MAAKRPLRRSTRAARPRVLVVYKKSAYRVYVQERRHPQVTALIEAGDEAASRLSRAHASHEATLEATRSALRSLGAHAEFRHRSLHAPDDPVDLVVTVGGDGTLLRVSQLVGSDCPVVAINSAPEDSVGYFSAGSCEDVADLLAAALKGKLRATELSRMRVELEDELISTRVLNDVLFCHVSPAATARYAIRVHGKQEEHKSSGVWIATAAGSTAAIHSAGARPLPLSSQKLVFRVREPYPYGRSALRLLHGTLGARERLTLTSQVRSGRLFIDGPRDVHVVEIGARLTVSRSPEPLTLLGFRR
jgi:NAD+ kinase